MTLLETQNLAIGYQGKTLISDIHFTLAENQICCLLGANGAGKSTFLKTLLGLQPPLAGNIYWRGKALSHYCATELARHMAYVPQAHQHLFPFSVQDVVLMGRSAFLKWYQTPKKIDLEVALNALKELEIEYLAERYYHQLSGGEKQLVLIARAIAQQAKLLIMDEPTSSLDFGNQIRVLEKIKQLQKQQIALIITTHNPQQAAYLAENVVVLDKTLGFRQGPKEELLTLKNLAKIYRISPDLLHRHLNHRPKQ
ncbi:ABC transporter ATP-binding protein [Aggregatibacter sp. HMT-949]|uniref:ABC transporter ATP-binding protein n=1 Tax=Aggregatibacter sp. HMT-949 TaxID=3235088 RepID=UPI00359C6A4D